MEEKNEKIADILGKKMGKIGVYNFANIFVNKVWKNISFWILIAEVLIKLTEKFVFQNSFPILF